MVAAGTKVSSIMVAVRAELDRATEKFGPMASGHEAVAVIEEEFLEFRSAVFWGVDQRGRQSDPREEAIQLAAMAVRYVLDVAGKREPPPPEVCPHGWSTWGIPPCEACQLERKASA